MFRNKAKKLRKEIEQKVSEINGATKDAVLFRSLEQNIGLLDQLFAGVDVLVCRKFQNQAAPELGFCIYYCDGVVDNICVNEHIIRPLLTATSLAESDDLFRAVRDQSIWIGECQETTSVQEIIESIAYGNTLLLMDGCEKGLLLGSKSFSLRGITEPESEKALVGPREGFNESIMTNLSMIRRRLRTHQLKMRCQTLGRLSATSICVVYLDNIVNHSILDELLRRLSAIDIDGVLDSNYIAECIAEHSLMGFPTCGSTERPDVVAARLLEGRIALVVDGTPMVLTLPYLFIESFQSNEDYYVNDIYATFSRVIRILAFGLTILIPAVYIAVVAFHHEILHTELMVNITNERQSVPLPAALECFLMLLVFDILRETGVRSPSYVGQALSIVGALVIGQSAVEAKLIAAPMIIVVALTGITNLLVQKVGPASLLCRYFFLSLASMFGLSGILVGCSVMLIHLFNLESLGVPSLLSHGKLGLQDVKDTFMRATWPNMLTRLSPLSSNRHRARKQGGGRP